MKKPILGVVIINIIAIALIAYGAVTALSLNSRAVDFNELTQSDISDKAYVNGKVYASTGEFLEITHYTVLIPSGKEHYYLIFDEELSQCIAYRGSKDFSDEFDNGFSKDGVEIKGKIKKVSSDARTKFYEFRKDMAAEGLGSYNLPDYYIDGKSFTISIVSIAAGVMLLSVEIIFAAILRFKRKNPGTEPKALQTVGIILLFATFIAFIYVFSFI